MDGHLNLFHKLKKNVLMDAIENIALANLHQHRPPTLHLVPLFR